MKVLTPSDHPRGTMPAVASSPIRPVLDQLVAAVDEHRVCGSDLLTTLSGVPDPRARRGVRHQMATILGLALCAVLAGARSFAAIGEWAANASPRVLSALGAGGGPPCESTLRRTLQTLSIACRLATWDNVKRGSWTPSSPVLLRQASLRALGAAQGEFELVLLDEMEVNPTLIHLLRVDFECDLSPEELLERLDGVIDEPWELQEAFAAVDELHRHTLATTLQALPACPRRSITT